MDALLDKEEWMNAQDTDVIRSKVILNVLVELMNLAKAQTFLLMSVLAAISTYAKLA
jgi:hypothetical protein